MSKIINSAQSYVDDALAGLCRAHPNLRLVGVEKRVIARSNGTAQGKVGIVSGGGSGHLPLFCGYVGTGFLDACAVGNVFEGPTSGSCADAIRAADHGQGVLCLFGNYGGDKMNFTLAAQMAEVDGIQTSTVLGIDDVASAPPEGADKRRGVAGLILAYKCAGAAAEAGMGLEAVTRIAGKTVDRTRTIGFATAPCILPGAGSPAFTLEPGQVAFGMGIHGEPGLWTRPMPAASELADEILGRLVPELPSSDRLAVLVNGLGATPLEELFILFDEVAKKLEASGRNLEASFVGPYVTSMEMAGASVSVLALDDELSNLIATPADCPFWKV